jgi:O-antigen/teichoic acid export membrane protein
VGAPLLLLAALLLGQFITEQVNLHEVLWLAFFTILIITLVQWVMVRRHALTVVAFASEARKPRTWLTLSVPMMGVFLVTLGLGQSDLYFLEWLGDEQAVGHYAAAITTAHFILPIQTSIIALYAPLVAREIKSGSVQTNAAFLYGQRVMTLALAPVVLGLALAATPVMGFFGSDYQDAALVLRLLAVGNGAWALAALSALWLQYAGRGMTVMRITAITLLADSLLNALLIPQLGMLGAAASSTATSIGAAIATAWLARR